MDLIEDVQEFLRQHRNPVPPIDDNDNALLREFVDATTLQATELEKLYSRMSPDVASLAIQAKNLRALVEKARF